MKKAIVYIDGYNLYFELLKDTCWKWLDLWKFAECLLDGEAMSHRFKRERSRARALERN